MTMWTEEFHVAPPQSFLIDCLNPGAQSRAYVHTGNAKWTWYVIYSCLHIYAYVYTCNEN